MVKRVACLLISLSIFACADEDVSTLDGGRPSDATGSADALAGDARGDAAAQDAAALAEAGVTDAEPASDAEPAVDAAPSSDAEPPADTGPVDTGIVCPFDLTETTTATLRVTADDVRGVYVNGVLLEAPAFPARAWSSPSTLSIQIFRHPSVPNTIALQGTNLYNQGGLDRGLIADLRYAATSTSTAEWVTDARTRVATASTAGWTDAGFDDSAWVAATVEGAHGIGPWGAVLGTSNASWIWSYRADGAAVDKPTMESIFARATFYVRANGQFSDQPEACP